ncbi:uncharacterized protein BJ212DRAFT_434369 [Suillus subaureus]|uniref:Uncharacterized protein n=1 Tax=Suillus subaureus TaxID=48587 RepID=A0A9P7E6L9_9AGAM|nr:uncharacterized protein BJ212DRAFT_434369 [Suillus subaureus]KAG1812822.1 hypothetical protein BJ212DRAFT_434369 [Suillus subaureus]
MGSSTSTLVKPVRGNVPQPTYMHAAHRTSSITCVTLFSTQSYAPPSSTPGFTGGRTGDKGFSDVLQDEEISEIRPHFPALTRLPRTWTLLYSLDPHERTIFCRCWLSIITLSRIDACWPPLFNCSSYYYHLNLPSPIADINNLSFVLFS